MRQQRTRIQAVSYCNKSITRSYNSQFQLANSTMESCVQQLRSELYALRKFKCEYRRHQDLPAAQTWCRYPSRGVRCCIFSRPGSCRTETSSRSRKSRSREPAHARSHESKFQVVKLAGGSTNGMPRSMACSSEQEPNLVNMRLTTSRLFRTPGRIANHLLIIGETSLQRTIRTWQIARSALQNRSAGLDKHSPPGLDRP